MKTIMILVLSALISTNAFATPGGGGQEGNKGRSKEVVKTSPKELPTNAKSGGGKGGAEGN